MLIGQSPGARENKTGQTFDKKGACGKMVREAVYNTALESEIRLTNAVKCHPKRNRPITREEILNCQVYLLKEIMMCKPRWLIPLGNIAMQSLTGLSEHGLEGIGSELFVTLEYKKVIHTAQVIKLSHPSYALRQGKQTRNDWIDTLSQVLMFVGYTEYDSQWEGK